MWDTHLEPLDDGGRDKTFDRTAEFKDILDQARTDIRIFFGRHQEDGFDPRGQTPVHERHL